MAGSRRAFVYTDDSGKEYVAQLDESTYEDAALGFKSALSGSDTPIPIIRGNPIKMRYINCFRDESGVTIRRRFFVGDNSQPCYQKGGTVTFGASPGPEDPEEGTSWQVSSSIGEKRRFIGGLDTGKKDGDQENVDLTPADTAEGGTPPSGQ